MEKNVKICYSGGSGRIEEKKSVFIADVLPIHDEADATAFMDSVRKRYWDASHHCYAYVLKGIPEVKKFSDAGEPSGTAGKPILDVIEGNHLEDVMIIVTRYFGGTLLGTGGLVRAYQSAAKEGISNSIILDKHDGELLTYVFDYDFYGKIQKFAEKEDISIINPEFTDKIKIKLAVDKSFSKNIIDKVEEMSAAKANLVERQDISFIIKDGKVIIL